MLGINGVEFYYELRHIRSMYNYEFLKLLLKPRNAALQIILLIQI